MPSLSEYGKAIRKIRLKRKISLKEMSKSVNYNLGFMSALENGKYNVTRKIIENIHKKYFLSEE